MANSGDPYHFQQYGDFYADPEDIYKGVTLGQTISPHFGLDDSSRLRDDKTQTYEDSCSALGGPPCISGSTRFLSRASSSGSWLDGDYYAESEDIFRGVTLGPTFDLNNATSKVSEFEGESNLFKYELPARKQDLDLDYPSSLSDNKTQTYETNGSSFEQTRFLEPTEAPVLPEDQEVDLSNTTLTVTPFETGVVQTSAELGNALLDFLQTEVISAIDKVKPSKYWIRSRVFIKSGPRAVRYTMCFLKIRIYKATVSQNTFFVEFARRSGDALVFSTIFRQASQYLHKLVYISGVPPAPPGQMQILPLFPVEPVKPTVLTPLLDMAAATSQPSLQAEAAAALADIADQGEEGEVIDKALADSLCTDKVFQAVQKLLCASDVGVLYPLARFLLLICSGSAKADGFLANDGLLERILNKTFGMGNSFVVAREMSQILSISLPRCTHLLAQDTASSLHKQLSTAANVATGKEVQANLREAARAFK